MAYLTWREHIRSGPVCLGVLVLIAGAVVALLPRMGSEPFGANTGLFGALIAVVGLVLILIGFFFTKKKRDSVLAPIDTRQDDVPPPPPPPD
ncbi:MAG: LPXTG cell wall anchor domain-containing protein [Candidatus Thorarchaeota archaeon]|nr:LPXTG cell wall anchor domain-containing protein [Candidatus Thorarchaeota archaeon]